MAIVATLSLILDAGRAYLWSLSIMTAGSLAYTLRSVKEYFQADFNTGTCFPGIPTICDFSGLSRPTVIDAIKELEDWGLVEVIRRPGSHNVYQLKYWWGSEATSTKNLTGGVKNFNPSSKISCTLTTDNNKNHINRANVVNRTESENSSASLAEKEAKKLVYQLRIADIQQQQSWTKAIQEQFRRLFHKELPAELIDEKFAQGLSARFILEILKNIYDPSAGVRLGTSLKRLGIRLAGFGVSQRIGVFRLTGD